MAVISNLRQAKEFACIIADRGWHAWWADSITPLADYQNGIEQMATGAGIPCALVAHDGPRYLGSVLLVESDLDSRPEYSPWIAALWVEPAFRRKGVALDLVNAARDEASRLGWTVCYLCATPANSPYYLARGFRLLERGVDGLDVLEV